MYWRIHWRTAAGVCGKGTAGLEKHDADVLAERMNKEYPHIRHVVVWDPQGWVEPGAYCW